MAPTASGTRVEVTGTIYSWLLFENASSEGDQEGFLIGDVIRETKKVQTDSQMDCKTESTAIRIHSVMPLPRLMSFYDSVGNIDIDRMKEYLKNDYKNVVGWFIARRNVSVDNPSIRQAVLHTELRKVFSEFIPPDLFLLALLGANIGSSLAHHIYTQHFLQHVQGAFQSVTVKILNLGDYPPANYITKPKTEAHENYTKESWPAESFPTEDLLKLPIVQFVALHNLKVQETFDNLVISQRNLVKLSANRDALKAQVEKLRQMKEEKKRNEVSNSATISTTTNINEPVPRPSMERTTPVQSSSRSIDRVSGEDILDLLINPDQQMAYKGVAEPPPSQDVASILDSDISEVMQQELRKNTGAIKKVPQTRSMRHKKSADS